MKEYKVKVQSIVEFEVPVKAKSAKHAIEQAKLMDLLDSDYKEVGQDLKACVTK